MKEIKNINLEGIFAFKDPKAETKARIEKENNSLFNFDNNELLNNNALDDEILNNIQEIETQATTIEEVIEEEISILEEEILQLEVKSQDFINPNTTTNDNISQLETTKNEIENNIKQYQADLKSVNNGEHPEVKEAQKSLNTAQENYAKALDETQNEEIIKRKEAIEENNLNILEQESTIAYIKEKISETLTQISQTESSIASLDSEIGAYESQIYELQGKLNSTKDSKQQATINAKINSLQKLKGNAQAQKENQKAILEALNEMHSNLDERKVSEEEKLEQFKLKQNELEQEIIEIKDETTTKALQELQNARQNLEIIKEELIKEINLNIQNANIELQKTQSELDKAKQEAFIEEQKAQEEKELSDSKVSSKVYPKTNKATNKKSTKMSDSSNESSLEASEILKPEKIEDNLKKSQEELKINTQELINSLDWSNQTTNVSKARNNKDSKFEKFCNELSNKNPNLALEIRTTKEEMDKKEESLDKVKAQLSPFDSAIENLESQKTYINFEISSLEEMQLVLLETKTDDLTTEQKKELKEKQEEIKERISELNKEKILLNQQINEIKQNEDYKKLKKEETKFEAEFSEIQSKFNSLMSQAESFINTKDFNKANSEYNNEKQKVAQNVVATKSKVEELQKTDAIEKAQNSAQDYKFSALNSDEVLNLAQSFIGCNEADGSANKFLNGGSSSSTPWCAAFVDYVIKNSQNSEEIADWYENIDNKWYCQNVFDSAKENNALISQEEAQAGDLILFYSDSKGRYAHIGFIESIDENGIIHTIEGNTQNQVARREYDPSKKKLAFCRALS